MAALMAAGHERAPKTSTNLFSELNAAQTIISPPPPQGSFRICTFYSGGANTSYEWDWIHLSLYLLICWLWFGELNIHLLHRCREIVCNLYIMQPIIRGESGITPCPQVACPSFAEMRDAGCWFVVFSIWRVRSVTHNNIRILYNQCNTWGNCVEKT